MVRRWQAKPMSLPYISWDDSEFAQLVGCAPTQQVEAIRSLQKTARHIARATRLRAPYQGFDWRDVQPPKYFPAIRTTPKRIDTGWQLHQQNTIPANAGAIS